MKKMVLSSAFVLLVFAACTGRDALQRSDVEAAKIEAAAAVFDAIARQPEFSMAIYAVSNRYLNTHIELEEE